MKKLNLSKSYLLTVLFLSFFVTGCSKCLDFSDESVGTQFTVGQSFTDNGINVDVEQFQWPNGTWATNGRAEIKGTNLAGGTGNEINTNNVNLKFNFNYPGKKIVLKFAELGGNNNINVNGTFQNVADLINIDGTVIDGNQITVTATQQGNNWVGTMIVDGNNISAFSIGGQELWMDDVCFTK
ncbi:MAG: hypothetical protein ACR2NC_02765 [Thermodesulfobacteriota bacterium]